MALTGSLLIGGTDRDGTHGTVHGLDAATGAVLDPRFGGASLADLDDACAFAAEAFPAFSSMAPSGRAKLLEAIAQGIVDLGDILIERAMQETGLPRPRLEGERGRTCGQLRMFADVLRTGSYLEARIDTARPDAQPPRPDLRLMKVATGPVAVFGASNFPLAFSVAGGDTASALAAGCPVVVKAHPAHPGTSELVGRAIQSAITDLGLPAGIFSLIVDSGHEIGAALVADPRISAAAFTGSRRGGLALVEIARQRNVPIPVYAEMSSINPVILLPASLRNSAADIARRFVTSLTLGAGQFCTNPGLLLAISGEGLEDFLAEAEVALQDSPAQTMLSPAIAMAFEQGIGKLAGHAGVTTRARGLSGHERTCRAGLFMTEADAFLRYPELQEEIFGAASLVVICRDMDELLVVVDALEGQLTAAIHMAEEDIGSARHVLPALQAKAGRLLVNDFGTGVAVSHAMVHGGPYPATSDVRSTSVGSLAIDRFLRPICYQDMPDELLPAPLQRANPLAIPRLVDGSRER